jgi:hypothetical protein
LIVVARTLGFAEPIYATGSRVSVRASVFAAHSRQQRGIIAAKARRIAFFVDRETHLAVQHVHGVHIPPIVNHQDRRIVITAIASGSGHRLGVP